MKINSKISFIILSLTLSFILSNFVLAVTKSCPPGTELCDPFAGKTIFTIIQNIIGYLIKIGSAIVAGMIIYGGFQILTAGDNPEKVKGGKSIILWAVVGYIIVICSWGIIYILGQVITGEPEAFIQKVGTQ